MIIYLPFLFPKKHLLSFQVPSSFFCPSKLTDQNHFLLGPQFVLGSFLFLMAALAAVVVFRIYSESKVAQTVTIAIQAEKSKERSDSTSGDEQPDHFENQPLLLN